MLKAWIARRLSAELSGPRTPSLNITATTMHTLHPRWTQPHAFGSRPVHDAWHSRAWTDSLTSKTSVRYRQFRIETECIRTNTSCAGHGFRKSDQAWRCGASGFSDVRFLWAGFRASDVQGSGRPSRAVFPEPQSESERQNAKGREGRSGQEPKIKD